MQLQAGKRERQLVKVNWMEQGPVESRAILTVTCEILRKKNRVINFPETVTLHVKTRTKHRTVLLLESARLAAKIWTCHSFLPKSWQF